MNVGKNKILYEIMKEIHKERINHVQLSKPSTPQYKYERKKEKRKINQKKVKQNDRISEPLSIIALIENFNSLIKNHKTDCIEKNDTNITFLANIPFWQNTHRLRMKGEKATCQANGIQNPARGTLHTW